MKIQNDFLKIGKVDIEDLRKKVAEIPDDEWSRNALRQKRFAVHQDTQTIHLIFDDDFRHQNPTVHDEFQMFEKELKGPLGKIARYYNSSAKARRLREKNGYGYFVRINLVRLSAGGVVKRHIDRGYSLAHSHRVHLPVITNDRVLFTVGDTTITMKEGELWEVCNRRGHNVENNSDSPRIHCIIDYAIPGERCCCGERLRPNGVCNESICEPTDMARLPCDCFEKKPEI